MHLLVLFTFSCNGFGTSGEYRYVTLMPRL